VFRDYILLKILPLYNDFYTYKFGLRLYQGLTVAVLWGFP